MSSPLPLSSIWACSSRLLRRVVDPERINALWETLPDYAFWRLSPDQLVWTTETVVQNPDKEDLIAVRPVQPHGVSELLVCVPDHDGLFADITAVLDEMGMDVMSARVLTTRDALSYDLFQVMDQHGEVINEVDADELVARLEVATDPRQPRTEVRRKLPRRLRHFSAHVRVEFAPDPDDQGTVMRLACTDQPGLLSRVAAAIHDRGVQVHGARIATFGEKVEDTFLLSDRAHRPLSEEAMEALRENICKFLE